MTATKRFPKRTPAADTGKSPSELIDLRIAELQDWRAALLIQLRAVIANAASQRAPRWLILRGFPWDRRVFLANGVVWAMALLGLRRLWLRRRGGSST